VPRREAQIGVDVTLVHDYLLVMRGAERTFAAIADQFARAPIFTLLFDQAALSGRFDGHAVHASSLNRLPVDQRNFRRLLPLYPWAIGRFALPPSDVVVTSSSAFAHGVPIPPGAAHVCYCHAPFRYAWNEQDRALLEVAPPLRPLLRAQLRRMRRWDVRASRSVDVYLANSQLTAERIKRYYGRDSTVLAPPVETSRFSAGDPGDRLLIVTELVAHKRIDVALEAARRTRAPIDVVGTGPAYRTLREAYPEARFLGRVSDEELAGLYQRARAVIVTAVEEFGITAVEAQAAGRPVLAARGGGTLETVLEGTTGIFAEPGDVASFAAGIEALPRLQFDPQRAVDNARRFSVEQFSSRLTAIVQDAASGG
jgi:glycosyltransferase involved in cell wall biosynthesis